MRILMMGTGGFAVPTFRDLVASAHEVPAVVTRPTRPASGKKAPPPNPMLEAAQELGIAVEAPESINSEEGLGIVAKYHPDLLVVCDYGQILSSACLSIPKLGGINLHGSLLPKYRGAAPVQWAVYNGDAETGSTVIHMTPKLDGGPILAKFVTPIDPDENALELEQRLAQQGVAAVQEAIAILESWDGQAVIGQPQDAAQVTKAPRLKKQDGLIDWQRSGRQIYDQLRAFTPWPGVFTNWQRSPGKELRLIVAEAQPSDSSTGAAPAGSVVAADANGMLVACGSGSLRITKLQPAGKRVLAVEEFLRGYPIQPGDQLA
ncbi:MAG: methionyl-tRNA formyltransferase [Planctomycetales bacterium]|nr:methionyl-tRNA formyltransferase [Planctomycetales bacterium]